MTTVRMINHHEELYDDAVNVMFSYLTDHSFSSVFCEVGDKLQEVTMPLLEVQFELWGVLDELVD
jgi:hypothetical protein